MKGNNSKSDILLKVILIIGSLALIGFGIILTSHIFEDRFTDLDDYEYKYVLEPRTYEVGVDIPAGKYVVQMENAEEAEINIYEQLDSDIYFKRRYYVYDNEKGEKDILKVPFGAIGISGVGGKAPIKKRVKNVTLEEGQLFEIEPEISFIFYSNTAGGSN